MNYYRPQPKHKVMRSKKYRTWISSHPCVICGKSPCDPHHEPLGKGGLAIKCPDSQCLPLCHPHHVERHNKGRETFWRGYNPEMLIIQYLTEYLNNGK